MITSNARARDHCTSINDWPIGHWVPGEFSDSRIESALASLAQVYSLQFFIVNGRTYSCFASIMAMVAFSR